MRAAASVILTLALVVAFSTPAEAQKSPSYACSSSNYSCDLFVELCNKGTLDVSVVVGFVGKGWKVVKGFYSLETGQCITISRYQTFNLAFITKVKGRRSYLRLDANKKEITYYQRGAGLVNAMVGERQLVPPMGDNAGGRTCIPTNFSAFTLEVSSWDGPCPAGYMSLPLSNYFHAHISNPEPYTGFVKYAITIRPTSAMMRPFEGRGVLTFDNGKYEGETRMGLRHGRGVLTLTDGYRAEGNWVDGMLQGQGSIRWSNGDRYDGELKDDNAHGQGTIHWSNGSRYEGQFRANKREGHGTYHAKNGDSCKGDWNNGKMVGKGKGVQAATKKACYVEGGQIAFK